MHFVDIWQIGKYVLHQSEEEQPRQQSFCAARPQVWHNLPPDLRQPDLSYMHFL